MCTGRPWFHAMSYLPGNGTIESMPNKEIMEKENGYPESDVPNCSSKTEIVINKTWK